MKKLLIFLSAFIPLICLAQSDSQQPSGERQDRFTIGVQLLTEPSISTEIQEGGLGTANNEQDNFIQGYLYGTGNGTYSTTQAPNPYNANKFNDHSYSFGFYIGYHLSSDWMIRLRLGVTKYNLSSSIYTYDSTAPNYIETISQNASYLRTDWQFALGIERISSIKYFDFYGGGEWNTVIRGIASANWNALTDTNKASFLTQSLTGSFGNGWSTGLGFFLGCNFRYKFLALGPEFSFAFMYNHYGGNYQEQIISNGSSSQNYSNNFGGYELIKWQISPVIASINLSIHF